MTMVFSPREVITAPIVVTNALVGRIDGLGTLSVFIGDPAS